MCKALTLNPGYFCFRELEETKALHYTEVQIRVQMAENRLFLAGMMPSGMPLLPILWGF